MSRSRWYRTKDRWWMLAWERLVYSFLRTFATVTRPVGTWWLARQVGMLGANILPLIPVARKRLDDNFAIARPGMSAAEKRTLRREACRHFAKLSVEYAHFDRFIATIDIEVEGIENIAAPLAEGRGVVMVTAHYGNWEALRIAAGRAGHECGIIYRPFNNRLLDAYTLRLIVAAGGPVMQKGPKGMRALHGHVARGGLALILVDQRTTGAPLIPFLGHPAETLTVAANLAARTGAALVPAVAPRLDGHGRFGARFEAEIPAGEPMEMMAAVNARIGAWIEEDPPQWFWLHRRWRRKR
ncbi:MAG: lysophospholipid acyltransferase family protein [Pseudomonadota bacterium]